MFEALKAGLPSHEHDTLDFMEKSMRVHLAQMLVEISLITRIPIPELLEAGREAIKSPEPIQQ